MSFEKKFMHAHWQKIENELEDESGMVLVNRDRTILSYRGLREISDITYTFSKEYNNHLTCDFVLDYDAHIPTEEEYREYEKNITSGDLVWFFYPKGNYNFDVVMDRVWNHYYGITQHTECTLEIPEHDYSKVFEANLQKKFTENLPEGCTIYKNLSNYQIACDGETIEYRPLQVDSPITASGSEERSVIQKGHTTPRLAKYGNKMLRQADSHIENFVKNVFGRNNIIHDKLFGGTRIRVDDTEIKFDKHGNFVEMESESYMETQFDPRQTELDIESATGLKIANSYNKLEDGAVSYTFASTGTDPSDPKDEKLQCEYTVKLYPDAIGARIQVDSYCYVNVPDDGKDPDNFTRIASEITGEDCVTGEVWPKSDTGLDADVFSYTCTGEIRDVNVDDDLGMTLSSQIAGLLDKKEEYRDMIKERIITEGLITYR